MKPFYGIDRTVNKNSPYHEGDCFIAATVSEFTRQSYDRTAEAATAQAERARLSLPLRFAKAVCGWTAALIALGVARSLGSVTLAEAYENAPFLYWTFAVCAAGWLALTLLGGRKTRTVTAEEHFTQSVRRLESETDRVHRELGVPENAKQVDVIQLTHRWKDGKLKISTRGMETTPYTNISMRVFRREDHLCFVDLEHRYELPLDGLRCLKKVKKPLLIQGWTKDEPINAEYYKPYKLAMDEYGRVRTRAYGLLELTCGGVDWAVWLPPYELNYISALTGLPVTEE